MSMLKQPLEAEAVYHLLPLGVLVLVSTGAKTRFLHYTIESHADVTQNACARHVSAKIIAAVRQQRNGKAIDHSLQLNALNVNS
jgi:hypothetical protein